MVTLNRNILHTGELVLMQNEQCRATRKNGIVSSKMMNSTVLFVNFSIPVGKCNGRSNRSTGYGYGYSSGGSVHPSSSSKVLCTDSGCVDPAKRVNCLPERAVKNPKRLCSKRGCIYDKVRDMIVGRSICFD